MSSKSFNDDASLFAECGKILNDTINTMTQCWLDVEGDPLQGYYDDDNQISATIAPLKTSLLPHLEASGDTGAKYLHDMLDLLEKHAGRSVEGVKADQEAYMADHAAYSQAHKALLAAVPALAEQAVDFNTWFRAQRERVQAAHAARDEAKLAL
mgnify:FL=1